MIGADIFHTLHGEIRRDTDFSPKEKRPASLQAVDFTGVPKGIRTPVTAVKGRIGINGNKGLRVGADIMTSWRMKITAAVLLCMLAFGAEALPRDRNQVNEFKRANPCPATGRVYGACGGWEVDHRVPLKCGGVDRPSNMQWLTKKAHKLKTKREARLCRKGKR